jgi:hypothetical protein
MTFQEFEQFQKELLEEVVMMGSTKGKEYAYSEEDRFQNFNELAKNLDLNRLKVAMVYVQKHIFSLTSFINKQKTYSNETIQNRIIDIITYMTLIAGMIHESRPKLDPFSPLVEDYKYEKIEDIGNEIFIKGIRYKKV